MCSTEIPCIMTIKLVLSAEHRGAWECRRQSLAFSSGCRGLLFDKLPIPERTAFGRSLVTLRGRRGDSRHPGES